MKKLQLFAVSDPETGNCFGLFFTQEEAQECQENIGIQGTLELIELDVKDSHREIFKSLAKKGK